MRTHVVLCALTSFLFFAARPVLVDGQAVLGSRAGEVGSVLCELFC
jgi:hypothetical protein